MGFRKILFLLEMFYFVSTWGEKSKVILLSMDGFRYDYLNKTDKIPNFTHLIESGVTMPYMNNSFVTKTFPCHYTMATGLYPEVHGIVANRMYDPDLNKTFTMANTETYWWDGGEPIWITAVKENRLVGVYFWPGSEAEIQGKRPTKWFKYSSSAPFGERVTTVVNWLADDHYDLAVLYFNEPDSAGHSYGPDSPSVVTAIERMDGILGQLLTELDNKNLTDKVNLIVTSDHGMTAVDVENRLIDLSELLRNGTLLKSAVDEGPTANLIPEPNKAKELVEALSSAEHLHVMLKENIPERFHLKNNKRVMPVFAYADEGWLITTNATKRRANKYYGDHGFDNELVNMKPFFIASGPAFRTGGQVVDPIQSVDIYPLICYLLDIPASPNNGSLERAKTLLRNSGRDVGSDVGSDVVSVHQISLLFIVLTFPFVYLFSYVLA
nr:bis(5'-adenosyl)-triphosphatase ENPP4-like isoform X1 [Biomphalaria glabrata]